MQYLGMSERLEHMEMMSLSSAERKEAVSAHSKSCEPLLNWVSESVPGWEPVGDTGIFIIQRFSQLASRIHCEVSLIQKLYSCRCFDYSVVVFFEAGQYCTETRQRKNFC